MGKGGARRRLNERRTRTKVRKMRDWLSMSGVGSGGLLFVSGGYLPPAMTNAVPPVVTRAVGVASAIDPIEGPPTTGEDDIRTSWFGEILIRHSTNGFVELSARNLRGSK